MWFAVVDFFFTEVADADLIDGDAELVDAAHDAGVAVRAAFVGVAEVGMSVDLDDADVVLDSVQSLDGGEGKAVFATEDDRGFPSLID